MATKLYFPLDTASSVNPSFETWSGGTSEAVRRQLAFTKGSSAITAGTTITCSASAGTPALDRQYVSEPLTVGTVFATSNSMSSQLMVREYAVTDNVQQIFVLVKVVSEDGNTLRATLRTLASIGTSLEFINNATHRNHTAVNAGQTLTAGYTTVAGDRLVIEIGYGSGTTGTTPQASAKWGEDATDLPINDTQTTDGAGWIEFSNTFTLATIYEESISFTAAAGLDQSSTASFINSLDLAAAADLSQSAYTDMFAVLDLTASCTIDQVLDPFGPFTYEEELTLAAFALVAQSVNLEFTEALDLLAAAGQETAANLTYEKALELLAAAETSQGSMQEFSASLSLGASAEVDSTVFLNLLAEATFAVLAAQDQSAAAEFQSALNLAAAAQTTSVDEIPSQTYEVSLALGSSAGMSTAATRSARVVATINVGQGPFGVSSDGVYIYAANYSDSTISKINPATNTVVATIALGASTGPTDLTYDGKGSMWVSEALARQLTRFNTHTGEITAHRPQGAAPRTLIFDGKDLFSPKNTNGMPSQIPVTVRNDSDKFSNEVSFTITGVDVSPLPN